MKSFTVWHQRLLLATEVFSLHIRSRNCTTESIFVTEKNVFRSNLFPKQRNSPPKACQGEGRTTFLPLLSGNYLSNCWEVLRRLNLFLMPVLKGVKCLHITLLSEHGEGAEHHTSNLMQKVYFVSSDPETLQTTNICSSKIFPLWLFFL